MPTTEYGPKVQREVERIENSDGLTERDRELLYDYKRDMELDGLSDSWIFELLAHTRVCAERLDKSFADAEEEANFNPLWTLGKIYKLKMLEILASISLFKVNTCAFRS